MYRFKGEQYRVYNFPGTDEAIPYRLFVPSRWTPETRLPMLVTLRAGTSVDNSYRSNNDFVKQAEQRGYLVVTPMGYRPLRQPYYGSRYQIARPNAAAPPRGGPPRKTPAPSRTCSTSSTWWRRSTTSTPHASTCTARTRQGRGRCISRAKYPERFAAIVISSGPIVYDTYPFDRLKTAKMGMLVIHGDQDTANPMAASQKMAEAAKAAGVDTQYATVPGGTHLEAYLTYASQIFDFLGRYKKPYRRMSKDPPLRRSVRPSGSVQ